MRQLSQLTVEDIIKAIATLPKEQILEIDNEIHKYMAISDLCNTISRQPRRYVNHVCGGLLANAQ